MSHFVICKGITRTGPRCKRTCAIDYCHQHADQRKPPTPTPTPTPPKATEPTLPEQKRTPKPPVYDPNVHGIIETVSFEAFNKVMINYAKMVDAHDIYREKYHTTLADVDMLKDELEEVTRKYNDMRKVKGLYNKALTDIRMLNGSISELQHKLNVIEESKCDDEVELSETVHLAVESMRRDNELIKFIEYANRYDPEEMADRLGMDVNEYWDKFNVLRLRRNKLCHPNVGEYTDDEIREMLG